ncbi:MAG: T9SS C-terminal target domain-containing protein, partial [Cytophagales bacterium]
YMATLPEVTFFPKRVANKIYLSRDADYEIIDGYGNPLMKGKGKEIVCETLSEGVYYLNIDNKTEKFLKK